MAGPMLSQGLGLSTPSNATPVFRNRQTPITVEDSIRIFEERGEEFNDLVPFRPKGKPSYLLISDHFID